MLPLSLLFLFAICLSMQIEYTNFENVLPHVTGA